MSAAWILFEISINCIESGLFMFLLMKQLGHSRRPLISVIGGAALLATLISVMNFLSINTFALIIAAFIADELYAYFLFDGSIAKKLLWGSSSSIVAIICNAAAINIAAAVVNVNLAELHIPSETRFTLMVCYILIYAIFFAILLNLRKTEIAYSIMQRVVLVVLLIVGLCGLEVLIKASIALSQQHIDIGTEIILISASILIVLIGMFALFEYMGEIYSRYLSTQVSLEQAKMENQHLTDIQESYNAFTGLRHDYKNHLGVLSMYAQKGLYNELEQYLNQLNADFTNTEWVVVSGNRIVDAVISGKIQSAQSRNIPTRISVSVPGDLSAAIPDTQLCALLGNLLDNALEAQNGTENPYISFSIYTKKGMLCVCAENSSKGNYRKSNGALLSTKSEHGHGYGLKRIKQIVNEAGGFVQFNPESDKFCVEAIIPL